MKSDLNATQQIIFLLESAKSVTDRIFDDFPGVFMMLTIEGRILRANAMVATFLGRHPEEVLGLHVRELFSASDWVAMNGALETFISCSEGRTEFELPLRDANGQSWFFACELILIRPRRERHEPIILLLARDISQLKQAIRKVAELDRNLELARTAQKLLLPQRDTLVGQGWALAAYFEPTSHAGGDWWNYDVRDNGTVRLFLGDVTGHDVGAAMVTAMIAGAFKALSAGDRITLVDGVLEDMNTHLCGLPDAEYWMTMAALQFGPGEETARWWSAAAPRLLRVDRNGEGQLANATPGRPLGSGPLSVVSGEMSFASGDQILIATDGLFDLLSAAFGELRSVRKLISILVENKGNPVAARAGICAIIREMSSRAGEVDDIAFIIVERVSEDRVAGRVGEASRYPGKRESI